MSKETDQPNLDQLLSDKATDCYTNWLESSAELFVVQQVALDSLGSISSKEARHHRNSLRSYMKNGQMLVELIDTMPDSEVILDKARRRRAKTIFLNLHPELAASATDGQWEVMAQDIVSSRFLPTALHGNSFVDQVLSEQKLMHLLASKSPRKHEADIESTQNHIKSLVEYWHERTIVSWLTSSDDASKYFSDQQRSELSRASFHPRGWNARRKSWEDSGEIASEALVQ